MGLSCSACVHSERAKIDAALVSGESERAIAARFGLSKPAVHRHKARHTQGALATVAEARAAYVETRERAAGLNIAAELGDMFDMARKTRHACDLWLRDPLDPDVYFLGARSDEVWVVHETTEMGEGGRLVRRRERMTLSELIRRGEDGAGGTVLRAEIKHSDIRDLTLKSLTGSLQVIETVTGLIRDSFEISAKSDKAAQIQVMTADEVHERLQHLLVGDCQISPKAFESLLQRLAELAQREAAKAAELSMEDGE